MTAVAAAASPKARETAFAGLSAPVVIYLVMDIYFDNGATTQPLREVAEALGEMALSCYGNPSSKHGVGIQADLALDGAREDVSAILGCAKGEVAFTSGGTESNNIALFGALNRVRGKRPLAVATTVEHPSVLEPLKRYAALGGPVRLCGVGKDGSVDLGEMEEILAGGDVGLISVMHVNNETGAVQPIGEVRALRDRHAPRAVIHVDGVQSFCKMRLLPAELGVDLYSASGHKVHGPKGAGLLYVRKGLDIAGPLYGGGQERGVRPGTQNVPAAAAFALAAKALYQRLDEYASKARAMTERLREGIREGTGLAVFNPREPGACGLSGYILNVGFPGVPGEALLRHLDSEGVRVSTGSACSGGGKGGSHVLRAMGVPDTVAKSAIRISLSHMNGMDEVEAALPIILRNVGRLARR